MTPVDRHGTGDTPMTGLYIAAIVLEVAIIALLWVLGRLYS